MVVFLAHFMGRSSTRSWAIWAHTAPSTPRGRGPRAATASMKNHNRSTCGDEAASPPHDRNRLLALGERKVLEEKVKEVYLWHGCHAVAVKPITRNAFDERFIYGTGL